MAVATSADVAVALGRPLSTPGEQGQVDYWLDAVELLIEARLGSVATLNQDVVKYVEVEAVIARLNRGNTAESSITVSVDDGSVTRRYENGSIGADITDDWWDLLAGIQSTSGHALNGWLA